MEWHICIKQKLQKALFYFQNTFFGLDKLSLFVIKKLDSYTWSKLDFFFNYVYKKDIIFLYLKIPYSTPYSSLKNNFVIFFIDIAF